MQSEKGLASRLMKSWPEKFACRERWEEGKQRREARLLHATQIISQKGSSIKLEVRF